MDTCLDMKDPSPLRNVKILQNRPDPPLDETDKWTKLFEAVVLKGRRELIKSRAGEAK